MGIKELFSRAKSRENVSLTKGGQDKLKEYMVNSPQVAVLSLLAEHGDLSINEIANELDKDPSKVRKVVNALIRDGDLQWNR